MTDVLVIGAGLSGLFASYLAARRGASVTNLAQGRGGLELSHGCIDISYRTPPLSAVELAPTGHPYSLVGPEALRAAMDSLNELLTGQSLAYHGDLGQDLRLPTAGGSVHKTALAPAAMAAGDLSDSTPCTLGGLAGFRDFFPQLALRSFLSAQREVAVLDLPLVELPLARDMYATDLGRLFDRPAWRQEITRAWKPRLYGVKRLGLPAVLGLHHHLEVVDELQDRLELRVFEIPTLPPSLPGLRLEMALRQACQAANVAFIDGTPVIGRVDGRTSGRRVAGAVAMTAGGPRSYSADVVILATGGILHGGLVAHRAGNLQESVFDLPVKHDPGRDTWTGASPFTPQPYEAFGVIVDDSLRPLGAGGRPLFENLYAVGGLLAGAQPAWEGSRQGIDIGTAYRAVGAALA
jgi:glycerol-3-phosphate dehydrogenase subunit B